jgi:hypothetical protein
MTPKASLALVLILTVGYARLANSQDPDRGPSRTYRNSTRQFDLDGRQGKLHKLQRFRQSQRWYNYDLTFKGRVDFTWPNGDHFHGWVYKVNNYNVWYFLSDDPVTIRVNGRDVERYPIARSTVGPRRGFFRIKVPNGTTMTEIAYYGGPSTPATEMPEELEIEGDPNHGEQ